MNLKLKIFLIITLLLTSFSPVWAQVRDSDISIEVIPEIPKPFENVTVNLRSFAGDLDKAQIIWILNGQVALSGTGKKSFSFQTGDSGEPSTLDVNINIVGIPSISKRTIIQPGEVDMLWQAVDSYVPPFYRGKALPSQEGAIKVVAMPNIKTPSGERLKDKDFSFNWERNFNADKGLSGYAKRSFTFQNSYLDTEENISVSISSVLGNYTAEGKVLIKPFKPKVVFYERDPALGVNYRRALTDDSLIQKSLMQIIAEPYFFSSNPTSNDLDYRWLINNKSADTAGLKNILVVKVGEGSGEQAKISLSVKSLSKIFQTADVSALFDISQ